MLYPFQMTTSLDPFVSTLLSNLAVIYSFTSHSKHYNPYLDFILNNTIPIQIDSTIHNQLK